MLKQISDDWINRQLELCENSQLCWAENYALVLRQLQDTQGELRLVFAILESLLLGMDNLPYENIKRCIASLVCAGLDWLRKEMSE